MWLVAGLGNPGPKYDGSRHNVGFMALDVLAERFAAGAWQTKFKGLITKVRLGDADALLLKPSTFMNLSGQSVQPALAFYKLSLDDLIVVHDDLDLDLGQIKLKKGGGHGGHNGIRDIAGRCGKDFFRVRGGIGRPRGDGVTGHVLGGFAKAEQQAAGYLVEDCATAVEVLIRDGLLEAQQRFHGKATG